MRKKLTGIVAFFLIIFFSFFALDAYSQTSSVYEESYGKYVAALDLYRKANVDYEVARSQYLKLGTLKSKEIALAAVLSMLRARDDVVINYLNTLKAKLLEGQGVGSEEKSALISKLEEEERWFLGHKGGLVPDQDFSDYEDLSESARLRYQSLSPFFYKVLTTISFGKVNEALNTQKRIVSDIQDKLSEIKNEEREEYKLSSAKIEIIERWIIEANFKINEGEVELTNAKNLISRIESARDKRQTYNLVISQLKESQVLLTEANILIKEIVEEIKTKEI